MLCSLWHALSQGMPSTQNVGDLLKGSLVALDLGLELAEGLLDVAIVAVGVPVDSLQAGQVGSTHIAQIFNRIGGLDIVRDNSLQHRKVNLRVASSLFCDLFLNQEVDLVLRSDFLVEEVISNLFPFFGANGVIGVRCRQFYA